MGKLVQVGDGPVNGTEREIVRLLVEQLPAAYRVIPNVSLSDPRRGQSYEYDAIVIAPHAVYVVEIKGWRGSLQAVSRRDWRLPSGKIVSNPLPLNDQKSKVLASLLRNFDLQQGGRRLHTPWVQSCLAVGADDIELDLFEDDQQRTLRPSELVGYLTDRQRLGTRHVPAADEYTAVLSQLANFVSGQVEGRDVTGRRYGAYKVESVESVEENAAVYLARHAEFDDGAVYRIRTWFVSSYLHDEAERENKLRLLKRGAEALHTVGSHPNVVSLREFGRREDDFYEVTDWSDTGTLSTALSMGLLQRLDVERKLELLLGIAQGLAAAAAKGVFHRNLTLEAILYAPDGRPRVGNFDHAFIDKADAGTVYADKFEERLNPYQPPELRSAVSYEVYDNSDLYSLARIAFDIFTGDGPKHVLVDPKKTGGPRRLSLLSERFDGLPDAIRDDVDQLLASCLSEDPDTRPDNPAAFVAALEAILRRLHGEDTAPAAAPTAEAVVQDAPEPAAAVSEADVEAARRLERQARGHFEADERIDYMNVVIEPLGRGAGSVVYDVFNEAHQDRYALKLFVDVAPDAHARLFQAFRQLRDVAHPHLVKQYWSSRHSIDVERGLPYLLLERLEGPTLADRLEHGPVITRDEALTWTAQLLDALSVLHPSETRPDGLVHRDIKPANLIVTERGLVLTDFESAVQTSATDRAPVGALRYTPPDLAETGWDASADLFAAGCILYEMLAGGARPWGDTQPGGATAPAPIAERVDDLPDALASVVMKSVAPRRADRFHAATAFLEALDAALQPPAPAAQPEAPSTAPEPSQTPRPSTRLPGVTRTRVLPDLPRRVSDASASLWGAELVSALMVEEHAHVVLYERLRQLAQPSPPQGADVAAGDRGVEHALIDAEARALALELPLPVVQPSLYDTLLERCGPLQAFSPVDHDEDLTEGETIAPLLVSRRDVLVVFDGLHPFEWHVLTGDLAPERVAEWVWLAGATDPSDTSENLEALGRAVDGVRNLQTVDTVDTALSALADGQRQVRFPLLAGRRGEESIEALMARRAGELVAVRDAALAACDARGAVWITTTHGSAYLGHGLRRDVGHGLTARDADRARGVWAAEFGAERVARTSGGLRAAIDRPFRVDPETRRVFVVGRLAWPDPPGTPRLAVGGLSLCERLLPIFRLTPETDDQGP